MRATAAKKASNFFLQDREPFHARYARKPYNITARVECALGKEENGSSTTRPSGGRCRWTSSLMTSTETTAPPRPAKSGKMKFLRFRIQRRPATHEAATRMNSQLPNDVIQRNAGTAFDARNIARSAAMRWSASTITPALSTSQRTPAKAAAA